MSRQSSRNSIEIFLNPDLETLANLEVGLAHLRGETNNNNNKTNTNNTSSSSSGSSNNNSSDHAFQVATLLLSHARLDFIREGIDIMERLTFRAFEEYRRLHLIIGNSQCNSPSSDQQQQQHTDNKLSEQYEQQRKQQQQQQQNTNTTTTSSSSMSENQLKELQKEKQKARDLLISGYFLLGIGQYKLQEYTNARNCVERVLELEPHHPQASALRDKVDEVVMKDALIGVGVVAAGVVAGAALLKGIFGGGGR